MYYVSEGVYGCFKPYYNWNTFNTYSERDTVEVEIDGVLNLIITGIPSIHIYVYLPLDFHMVLNLIITGIPSIQIEVEGQIVKKAMF